MERDHLLTTDSHESWSKLMWPLTGAHPKFVMFLEYFNSHRHRLHVAWVLTVLPYFSINISILIYFRDERRFHHCCFLSWPPQCWGLRCLKAALAHAEVLTQMCLLIFKIKKSKARLQDGAADHCFHFGSMCQCESVYSSTPSSDIDPYTSICLRTCM